MEGKFINAARLKAKMTQGQVAKALGYDSPQIISNIERGISSLPTRKVLKFCKLTRVSPNRYVDMKLRTIKKELRREIFR